MKLSQATREQKLKAAAELDGVTVNTEIFGCYNVNGIVKPCIPSYDTSYDAILPLIQKQTNAIKDVIGEIVWQLYSAEWYCYYDATPSQLLDSLLIATGKFEV